MNWDHLHAKIARSVELVTDDVWRPLRRRTAVFTAAGGLLFAAYAITQSAVLEGVVIEAPLLAASGFALGIARRHRPAGRRANVDRAGLVVFAVSGSA